MFAHWRAADNMIACETYRYIQQGDTGAIVAVWLVPVH